jgi:alpha-beta hydrolase superfamily lysophospholipase
MAIKIENIKVRSSNGKNDLAGVVFLPDGEARGILHIVHGMVEHIGRYKRFMEDMANLGYVCVGYDNLGHGNTARDASEFGYIAKKRGWELLLRDVRLFSDAVREKYGRELPYYLMGHSMGSFIVRCASAGYVDPDKLIIMGTGGPNPAADPGLALIAVIKAIYGEKHISKFVNSIAFSTYNERFGGGTKEDPSPWLSTLESTRQGHYNDRFCTFKFTVSAMGDLIRLIKYSNQGAWFKKLPTSLPVLLVAGAEDPVGSYGDGVRKVHDKLIATGHSSECIIYPDVRHEILNDTSYEDVKSDIIRFLEQ